MFYIEGAVVLRYLEFRALINQFKIIIIFKIKKVINLYYFK